jgi:hypothetical protein
MNEERSSLLTLVIAYQDALSQRYTEGLRRTTESLKAALHESHLPLLWLFLCSDTSCLLWNAALH